MAKIIKDINSSARVRHFDIVFYGTEQELLSILDFYKSAIQRYAYAFHDCDKYSDDLFDSANNVYLHRKGDVKVKHFHVVVSFYNACTLKACARRFKTENDNPRVYSVGDMVLAYEYLWHKNDLDKFQYSKSIVKSSDLSFYDKLCVNGERSDNDNKAEQIVLDLLAGVSTRVMVSRYGRDFVIHQSQYRECADRIKNEDYLENIARIEKERKNKALTEKIEQGYYDDIF